MLKIKFQLLTSFVFVFLSGAFFVPKTLAATYNYNPSGAGSFNFSQPGINTVRACNLDGICNSTTFYIDNAAPNCGSITQQVLPGGSVEVTVPCSDAHSGCVQNVYKQTYSANGNKSITISDKVGYTRNCSFSVTAVDKTPPNCGTITKIPTSWTSGYVTATVQCVGSDCQRPNYSTTFTANGTKNITIQDHTGNSRSCAISVSNIDRYAPSCGAVSRSPSSWTSGNVFAALSCYDTGGSGCQQSSYGSTFYSNGAKYVTIRDYAGNSRTCGISVSNIDKTMPVCSRTLIPSFWTNTDVTAVASCSDTPSGCQQSVQSRLVSSNQTVPFNIRDRANNTTSCNVNVWNIDKQRPTCTTSFLTTINSLGWSKEAVVAQAKCSDTGNSNCKSGQNLTTTITKHNSNHTFSVSDNANNTNTCTTSTVKIDRDSPKCDFEGTGWVTLPANVTPNCNDTVVQTSNNGVSGCKAVEDFDIERVSEISKVKVVDNADNVSYCKEEDLMVHYVEIRGTQGGETNSALKQTLANNIKQNVADLTRNELPNSTNTTLNYNLNNGTIAYYQGDVRLNAFEVSGKKTIIVENGSLTLNGNVTYDTNSILGIIVLGTANNGNVTISANVDTVQAILFAEGKLISEDQDSATQLYWKGSLITDNTIGGHTQNPQKCSNKTTNCNSSQSRTDDLNYFRSYHHSIAGAVSSSDPQKSNAPTIIEYDSMVQQNTPYGFEMSGEFSLQEIIN